MTSRLDSDHLCLVVHVRIPVLLGQAGDKVHLFVFFLLVAL